MAKFWKHKYLKYSIILVAALVFFVCFTGKIRRIDTPYSHYLWGDTLAFTVLFDQNTRTASARTSFVYSILKDLEKKQKCDIGLSLRDNEILRWEDLINGSCDGIIINAINDTVPSTYQDLVISTIPLNKEEDVCVVSKDNYMLVQAINYWLTYYKQTLNYKHAVKRYIKKSGHKKNIYISPFDHIIMRYSKVIGWDWRLLAALIHQESKFKIGVSSSRGAIGLMQIKEDVARRYGVTDIYDPEENIRAGVNHLKRIQNLYKNMGIDSTNLIKITLAAYNCGEGRLQDCMSVAKTEGKNPHIWQDIADIIPVMSGKEFSRREDISLGIFRGKETIKFVKNILEQYEYYKLTVKY